MKKLLVFLLVFAQPVIAMDAALIECRNIEDVAIRVACYDSLVDGLESEDTADAPDAQSLFGTNDADAKRIVAATLEIEQISQIEAAVTEVRVSASGKLSVSLDNGQIWRQLDNSRLRLKNGEAVVIREASLGSFQLEKKSGSRKIRMKRVN